MTICEGSDDRDIEIEVIDVKEIGERHGFTLGSESAWRVLMEATSYPVARSDALRAELEKFFSGDHEMVSKAIEEMTNA